MELKSLGIMTVVVLERESVGQVLKSSRNGGEQRVPPYLGVSRLRGQILVQVP